MIDADAIRAVRAATGKPIAECREALASTKGNVARAIKRLGGTPPKAPRGPAWRYRFSAVCPFRDDDLVVVSRESFAWDDGDGRSVLARAEHRLVSRLGRPVRVPDGAALAHLVVTRSGTFVGAPGGSDEGRVAAWSQDGAPVFAPTRDATKHLRLLGDDSVLFVGRHELWWWRAGAWRPLPQPVGGKLGVVSSATMAGETLVVGGWDGLWRLDGAGAWQLVPCAPSPREPGPFNNVFHDLASAGGRLFALRGQCELWRGDLSGMARVAEPGRLAGLAAFADRVWLCVQGPGLAVIDGETVSRRHPLALSPKDMGQLVASDALVAWTGKTILRTDDGEAIAELALEPRAAWGA